jgi:hypothetical protein
VIPTSSFVPVITRDEGNVATMQTRFSYDYTPRFVHSDGASHPATKDCQHPSHDLEERIAGHLLPMSDAKETRVSSLLTAFIEPVAVRFWQPMVYNPTKAVTIQFFVYLQMVSVTIAWVTRS